MQNPRPCKMQKVCIDIDTLRCVDCGEFPNSYALQCVNSHQVCGMCHSKRGECAKCKANIKNHTDERANALLKQIYRNCKKPGCPEVMKLHYEMCKHEEVCDYGNLMCSTCNMFSGSEEGLIKHYTSEHERNTCKTTVNWDTFNLLARDALNHKATKLVSHIVTTKDTPACMVRFYNNATDPSRYEAIRNVGICIKMMTLDQDVVDKHIAVITLDRGSGYYEQQWIKPVNEWSKEWTDVREDMNACLWLKFEMVKETMNAAGLNGGKTSGFRVAIKKVG